MQDLKKSLAKLIVLYYINISVSVRSMQRLKVTCLFHIKAEHFTILHNFYRPVLF